MSLTAAMKELESANQLIEVLRKSKSQSVQQRVPPGKEEHVDGDLVGRQWKGVIVIIISLVFPSSQPKTKSFPFYHNLIH